MGEGSRALLKVWGTPLGPFSESFEFKKKKELVQYRSRCGSTLLGEEPMRCHRLLVNRFLDKIKKEISFIKKKWVVTKKKLIAPKADLSA
jgi:hypothetical protein